MLFVEHTTGLNLEKVGIDNACGFLNMKRDFKGKDMIHTTSIQNSLLLNGLAEQLNFALAENVRAMLNDASMPSRYWGSTQLCASPAYVPDTKCDKEYHPSRASV